MSEAVGEGETPLEGTKAHGRIEPHPLLAVKEATDFRGVYCPEGERGGVGQSADAAVRANAKRVGLVERPNPGRGRGNLRRAKSQERYRLK